MSDEHRQLQERLAQLEEERRALVALCLRYGRLADSLVASRSFRAGQVLARAGAMLPGPVRARVVALGRAVARNRLLRSWLGTGGEDAELEDLHHRLFGIMYPHGGQQAQGMDDTGGGGTAPVVSVVAVLYNNARTVGRFLAAFNAQDYRGDIEVVLVDDCSSDDGAARVEEALRTMGAEARIRVRMIRNGANLGNCPSRNIGVRAATGEVIAILDADCIVNPGFVAAHVRDHRKGFDIVIGPMGIESRGGDIDRLMASLLQSRERVVRQMRLQDPATLASAVNCVTRNVSVTRAALQGLGRDLFDERFTYRKSPDTGFGWEDVEMGAALKRAGARIAFAWDALSIHVSHAPSVADETRASGSARNFALLMAEHPELYAESAEWALATASRISAWLRRTGREPPAGFRDVAARLGRDGVGARPQDRRICVYTAVAGGYDSVAPAIARDGVTYLQFSDDGAAGEGWLQRDFEEVGADPVRTAKKPKLLPHRYLGDFEWSIWLDGNVRLLANPQQLIAEVAAAGCAIGVFRHPEADCAYEEAIRCIRRGKDEPAVIVRHMERYDSEGYPRHNGLAECNVIVRRHNDPAVIGAMEAWWAEIGRGSRRDQISFNYALWKAGLPYHELGGGLDVRTDPRFAYAPHEAERRRGLAG